MEGGAWWAAVYGVAQSQTRLKLLSSSSSSRFSLNDFDLEDFLGCFKQENLTVEEIGNKVQLKSPI